jgi:4-hydroxy-2-oxoglutarate aldolase
MKTDPVLTKRDALPLNGVHENGTGFSLTQRKSIENGNDLLHVVAIDHPNSPTKGFEFVGKRRHVHNVFCLPANLQTIQIDQCNEFDLTGYKLLGSNAEYLGLTPDETIKVLRTVVAANTKKRTLVAGADRESVEAALDFIRIIADIGVDIASVMTPRFYARHMSDDSFVAYYTKIADDSPIPILIYIPPTSSSAPEMSAKALATLSKHENIIAVKVSSKRGISEYRSAVDAAADFLFLGGKIGNIVRDFEAGIVGAILSVADYWPQACIDLYRLFCEEQFDEAHKLCENIYTAYKEGPAKFGVAGVKYAMDLAGFFGGDPRLPLLALTDEQKSCISESFSALGKKLAIAI